MSVAPDVLLRGAWYALEQCGHLLQNAVALHGGRAYASAVALALLGREELGRYRILLDLWRQVVGGKVVSVEDVRAACDDHVTKQREGQLSNVYRVEGSGGLAELLRARIKTRPGTPQFKQIDDQVKQLDQTKVKRTPADRHSTRMRAMYVDINDGGTDWNRPAAMPEGEATNCLVDAANDYSIQANKLNKIEMLRALDAPLAAALAAWDDKPPLPAPTWPDQVGTEVI
jgi:AbiV family abortive infection protein